jgi:hypothetical protein
VTSTLYHDDPRSIRTIILHELAWVMEEENQFRKQVQQQHDQEECRTQGVELG